MKKVFLSIGLACLALNLESAALRQTGRLGTGIVRSAQPIRRALSPASQTARSIATLSQSNKSYGKHTMQLLDLVPLVPLGVAAGIVAQDIHEENVKTASKLKMEKQSIDFFNRLKAGIDLIDVHTEKLKVDRLCEYISGYISSDFSDQQKNELSVMFIERLLSYRLINDYLDVDYSKLRCLFENIISDDERNRLACLLFKSTKKSYLNFPLHYLLNYVKNPALRKKWVMDYLESSSVNVYKKFYVSSFLGHLLPEDADSAAKKVLEDIFFDYEKHLKSLSVERYNHSLQDIKGVINRIIPFIISTSDKERLIKQHLQHFVPHFDLFLPNLPNVQNQPLFCAINIKNIEKNTRWLNLDRKGNFNHLLPLIAEYVVSQYEQDRMVYFHGQNNTWIFLTDMYQALETIEKRIDFPEKFIPFRFTKKCLIPDIKDAVTVGLPSYNGGNMRPWILFVNLHLGANPDDLGSSTTAYIVENFDMSVASKNFRVEKKLTELFNDHGLQEEYEKFAADIKHVQSLFQEAIEDQGDYGRLIVISMPKETASEISYMAHPGGKIKKREIDGEKTADPVKWAQRYAGCGLDNEVGVCLTDDMLDPEKAKAAGITMQAFDPAIYWETEKAQKYKAALKDLMARIQASYQARKAQENSKENNRS